eukprot:4961514-Pyramimonas_sp.AAC.1
MRRVCIEAITQATSLANTKRALRTKTTSTGQHYYDEGDLVSSPHDREGCLGRLEWPIPGCKE